VVSPFRVTDVRGESLNSLVTHISIVTPMFAWAGLVELGGSDKLSEWGVSLMSEL